MRRIGLYAGVIVAMLTIVIGSAFATSTTTQTQSVPVSPQTRNAMLTAIRTGYHDESTPKYQRVVFELDSPSPFWANEYATQLFEDGSGFAVRMNGKAALPVQIHNAQAHNEKGQLTVPRKIVVNNAPYVKEIINVGDFEGIVTYAIVVDKTVATRTGVLFNPYRIVIDFLE
jgi:hypothetical protein